ncbi:MAG: LamG domain-containing protein [Verrucomicrobia bacterium]|nr:LamG domain-containing protein [Verrucomicrobiota bacterium]
MKRIVPCIAVFTAMMLIGTVWAGQDKPEPQLRLELDLTDGSRIIGTPRLDSLSVQTSYARMDIPLHQILTIKMGEDHETAAFDLRNGDKLKGVLTLSPVKLETVFGKVAIGVEHIKEINVILSGAAMLEGLRKALVLYYSFDRDEGGKVTDESGKGNAGEVKDAKWTSKGKVGGAYEMDGRSSQIESIRNVEIEGSKPRTLAAWIRCDDLPVGKTAVPVGFGRSNCYADPFCSGTLFAIGVHCVGGTKTIGMWGVNQSDVWSATPFSAGRWYHAAATFDGKTVRFYLDGKLDVSKEVPVNTATSPLAIGRIWGDYPDRARFVGTVDEVMVFGRALTEEEIRQIYDTQK